MRSNLRYPPLAPTLIRVALIVLAVFASWFAPYDPQHQELLARLTPPVWAGGTWNYPLGTDALGRDALSNIIYGLQVSLLTSWPRARYRSSSVIPTRRLGTS